MKCSNHQFLVYVWVSVAHGCFADTISADTASEQQAIRRVLDDQEKAWNKGDLEAYMTGYWKSDRLTFFSGTTETRGFQSTLDRYRKRYQTDGKVMGKLTFREIRVELCGADAAWVRGRWELMQTKDKHGGLFTLIFKKHPEGWRIVHDHTSGE